ncbi:MAG: lipoyl(octanoyl) transferase LipB [Gammaproteobacteria bacterium]|nr:lipoyl(octanoyl) transferase LipB [Gammaproteobacteria bacterium]NKB65360.1 lipoyl(octanoyl) transferase LipB [Gammaproteobacteria bacterium]
MPNEVLVKNKGLCDYEPMVSQMLTFTVERTNDSRDEIWLLQHPPVFTQGTSCKELPLIQDSNIPVVHSDRGGQITYHGPGQLICYLLLDLKRLGLGPKSFVNRVEQCLIDLLGQYQITANRKAGSPGVYVGEEKIAALGFRIKKGRCYHGLSLNIDMDLTPFEWINPCGYPGQAVTQMKTMFTHGDQDLRVETVSSQLLIYLSKEFGFTMKSQ